MQALDRTLHGCNRGRELPAYWLHCRFDRRIHHFQENSGNPSRQRRRHWLWLLQSFLCRSWCTRSGWRRSRSSSCANYSPMSVSLCWQDCCWAAFTHDNSDPRFRRMRRTLYKLLRQRRKMCLCSRWLKPLGACHGLPLYSFVDHCKAKIVSYKLLDRFLRGSNDPSSPKTLPEVV